MSVLKDAVNTSISNSSVTVLKLKGNTFNINPAVVSNSEGMSILLKYVALDAIHDASARFDAPRCSEGTREAVQEDIMTWTQLPILALALEKLRLFLWMTGAAGTGKSAIVQTIAETADKQSLLAASFFFSYKHPARDGMLIPTLAYQIAVKIPAVQEHMAKAIMNDRSVFSKSLEKQLDVLILEPIAHVLEETPSAAASWPKLIAIDGLDECKSNPAGHPHKPITELIAMRNGEANSTDTPSAIDDGEKHQLEIITLLHKALITRRLPFRVALASRPDMPMRGFFSSGPGATCTRQIDLNVAFKPGDDIRLFLRSSFERIRAKHDVEIGWPGKDVIEIFVKNASGQFVYADTVVKFVDGPSCDPTSNLGVIMEIAQNTAASQKQQFSDHLVANPYAPLDAIYAAILKRCPEPKESVTAIHLFLRLSIGTSVALPLSASDINTFLQYRSTDVARVFGKLHSLVSVPPAGDSEKGYSLHRKSLQDFLYSPNRCVPELFMPHQAVLESVSIQLLRMPVKFRIQAFPAAHPCADDCPYVIHLDGCAALTGLWVTNEYGLGAIVFSLNNTHEHILAYGYQATLLQGVLNSMDAYAWTQDRVAGTQNHQLEDMYMFVHNTTFGCRMFSCSSICSRWRKAIRQKCLRENWKVQPFSYRISQSPVFHPPRADFTDGLSLAFIRLTPT
ncbi:hypothetical protein FA15DRAFT_760198 [Coprinopsis marcescibilis]|uniref:Nephrocystin 3-like N-terminal domain-containing protein n=1 Tax=Coprinopsis marcescibilis TaxID=230819 RepID=A0A5C3KH66_COPMA|nr:hypothetical protein FA15DRAFT_760198 [Coprinopsis marcescibilis]